MTTKFKLTKRQKEIVEHFSINQVVKDNREKVAFDNLVRKKILKVMQGNTFFCGENFEDAKKECDIISQKTPTKL